MERKKKLKKKKNNPTHTRAELRDTENSLKRGKSKNKRMIFT